MLRSRSATKRTAWLSRTGWTVMTCSLLLVCRSMGRVTGDGRSGDGAEAAGPGDRLVGGEADLQEAEGLHLASPLEAAGVDGLEPAGGEHAGQDGLGVGVVAGDQDGGGQGTDGAAREGAGERGVE